jgi:hypothetical protein
MGPRTRGLLWPRPPVRAVPSITGTCARGSRIAIASALKASFYGGRIQCHRGLVQTLEKSEHVRRALEDPYVRTGERSFSRQELEVEMGPAAPIPQVQGRWRSAHPPTEFPQLGDIIGGRQDVRPARGPEIFPVHDDHRSTPAWKNSTVMIIAPHARTTAGGQKGILPPAVHRAEADGRRSSPPSVQQSPARPSRRYGTRCAASTGEVQSSRGDQSCRHTGVCRWPGDGAKGSDHHHAAGTRPGLE